MADKEDEQIDLPADDSVVEIDISDNLKLGEKPEAAAPPVPRVKLSPETAAEVGAATPPVEEGSEETAAPAPEVESAKALEEAVKRAAEAEQRLQAAEATTNRERQQREAALRLLAQREQEATAAQEQVEQHELTILTNGIEAAKREVEGYEAQLTTAYEAGDFKTIASLQTKLSGASARLDRLEDAKANAERRVPTVREGAVEAPVAPPVSAPPLEQYIQQSRFAPAAENWIRAHPECAPPEFGGDRVKNAKMMAGHYEALSKGFVANSEEYFKTIEEHTGHRKVAEETPPSPPPAAKPAAATKPKTPPAPSAPPSREPPASPGAPSRTRSVTLSPAQQEAARISFPNVSTKEAYALYARNLVELEAEGKIGRTTH